MYLTTDNPQNICEGVTTTAFQKYDAFVVIFTDVQWLLYLQDNGLHAVLIHGGDSFQRCMFSGYYIFKIEVVGL